MYCKKCNIVVHGNAQSTCPACNGPTEQTPKLSYAESENAIGWQKYKEVTLKARAPEPTPQPVLNQNPKYGSIYKILIVFLLVVIAGAAGYYFSLKEDEQKKLSFDLFKNVIPLRVPEAQIDNKYQALKPTVQAQKSADGRQPEPDKKDASQPMADPASLLASQRAALPASREVKPRAKIKENKPAEPAQVVALIEEKHAQLPVEEKKVVAPPQQKAAVKTTMYYISVASCKIKENADAAIKDLQKKGYEPAVDTITVEDTTWYRVTLGSFKTKGEAQNYARELHSRENIKGFVVKKKY
jgi:cell division septation protein DedD